jgi:hypothetical protein
VPSAHITDLKERAMSSSSHLLRLVLIGGIILAGGAGPASAMPTDYRPSPTSDTVTIFGGSKFTTVGDRLDFSADAFRRAQRLDAGLCDIPR